MVKWIFLQWVYFNFGIYSRYFSGGEFHLTLRMNVAILSFFKTPVVWLYFWSFKNWRVLTTNWYLYLMQLFTFRVLSKWITPVPHRAKGTYSAFLWFPGQKTMVKAHLQFSNLTFTLQQSNLMSAAGSPQQEEGNQLFLVNEMNQTYKIFIYMKLFTESTQHVHCPGTGFVIVV